VLLALASTVLTTTAQAAVTATVDRNRVSINDSLVLTLRATEGEDVEDADLDQLARDFDMVSTGTSTHWSLNNGRTARTSDLKVVLLPRRVGELVIPALTIDGQRTRAIRVQVSDTPVASDASEDVFVESEVDRDEVYVQSQLLHTFRIYEAIDLSDRGRSELKLEGAVVEELESSSFQRTINGRPYRVIEVKHAIFPQKSGELVIPSMTFNGRKPSGRRSILSFNTGEVLRRRSQPITVKVKPVPAAWPDAPWIPARNLRIEESWSALPDELAVGDSVTRTLTLVAEGIDSSQLPQIPQADLPGVKAYPDQPRAENRPGNDGITGIGVNSTALLITKPGEFTLPTVRVPWWDTESNSLRYAELPARSFTVAAPPTAALPSAPVAPTPVQAAPADLIQQTNLWMWATLAALLGWMGTTAWLGWRLRAPRQVEAAPRETEQKEAALFKECLAACNGNDAQASRAALQAWGQRYLDQQRPPTLDAIARHFDRPELAEALEQLERSLYAGGGEWRGDSLALALKACRKQGRKRAAVGGDALPPLYT
jgi:hypothetical protein